MNNSLISNAILISVMALGGGAYLSNKSDQSQTSKVKPNQTVITPNNQSNAQSKPHRKSASTVTLYKNPQNGHFWADAKVNTGRVNFLVDTGASIVTLTLINAKKSGIKTRDLQFNVPMSTANGTNYGARVKLENISVGAITLRDVDAIVIKDGLSTSLLGMSYLGQLQKVEATRDRLFLRL